jgi:DNA-binding NarL/FixJ family response regulator
MTTNTDELLLRISNKLSALIALSLPREGEGQTMAEKITLLSRCGLPNEEIASIVGTTKGTVQVLKSRARSRASRSATKKQAKP